MDSAITRRFWVRQKANDVLNWVFPTDDLLCAICGRPLNVKQGMAEGQKMCPFCLQDLNLCAVHPHEMKLQAARNVLIPIHSCLQYDHFIRTMIRSWKYDGVIELTTWFGGVLTQMYKGMVLPRFDAVVPVPSTADRTQKRGYDHVRLLATHLSSNTGLSLRIALLRSKTDTGFTQSQTAKNLTQRKEGLAGVYQHNKQVSVRGQHILLVDDIVTTGATLVSCATPLIRAGVASVTGMVVARVL